MKIFDLSAGEKMHNMAKQLQGWPTKNPQSAEKSRRELVSFKKFKVWSEVCPAEHGL